MVNRPSATLLAGARLSSARACALHTSSAGCRTERVAAVGTSPGTRGCSGDCCALLRGVAGRFAARRTAMRIGTGGARRTGTLRGGRRVRANGSRRRAHDARSRMTRKVLAPARRALGSRGRTPTMVGRMQTRAHGGAMTSRRPRRPSGHRRGQAEVGDAVMLDPQVPGAHAVHSLASCRAWRPCRHADNARRRVADFPGVGEGGFDVRLGLS